jgi:hypothetical protein
MPSTSSFALLFGVTVTSRPFCQDRGLGRLRHKPPSVFLILECVPTVWAVLKLSGDRELFSRAAGAFPSECFPFPAVWSRLGALEADFACAPVETVSPRAVCKFFVTIIARPLALICLNRLSHPLVSRLSLPYASGYNLFSAFQNSINDGFAVRIVSWHSAFQLFFSEIGLCFRAL